MSKTSIYTLIASVILIAVFGFIIYNHKTSVIEGGYDKLAKCLAENGVRFYGTTWCSHCKNQKELFGESFKYINYVECAISGNPRAQTEECKNSRITAYPTWEFSSGERRMGELSFEELSKQSGCPLN